MISQLFLKAKMTILRQAQSLSLVENVVRQIEDAIIAGQYKKGDKLPATRQLQQILGASLGTIREGLAILENKGLIEVRKGAKGGYFIREVNTEPMTESLELLMRHLKLSPRELAEFRSTIEAGVIRLVVKRATDEQIRNFLKFEAKFEACLNGGRAGWHDLLDAERSLRQEFMAVIDNRTYAAVLQPINSNIRKWADLYLPGDNSATAAACEYWKKILAAVKDRDEERAASLTKEMIFYFMQLILRRMKKAESKK
jgi:DNA-binding FadR family transcriptional regulator